MKVRFRRSALADLQNIHSYIQDFDPQAAAFVIQRIRHSITRLELFPNSGRQGALAGTRELVVPGLPYINVYMVETDHVDVHAIYHGDRNEPPG